MGRIRPNGDTAGDKAAAPVEGVLIARKRAMETLVFVRAYQMPSAAISHRRVRPPVSSKAPVTRSHSAAGNNRMLFPVPKGKNPQRRFRNFP